MTSATTGISSSTSTAPANAATWGPVRTQKAVDYNSFLLLLVQELKNQDPTQPSACAASP